MKFESLYGVWDSPNAAEKSHTSRSITRFAGSKTKKYLEERIASITEPNVVFEGILDIPLLSFAPLVFAYYLVKGYYFNRKLVPDKF